MHKSKYYHNDSYRLQGRHNMSKLIKQSITTLSIVFMIVMGSSVSMKTVLADDTDIYLNQNAASTDKPLIMFSLDYRSNLGNSVCPDSEDTAADGSCGQLVAEGYLDDDAITKNGNYSSLEVYRAVLKKVMDHELDTGITIAEAAIFGVMMNHDSENNCDGPSETDCSNGGFILSKFRDLSDGPTGGVPNNLKCDFDSLTTSTADDNANPTEYDKFFCALDGVPIPQSTWNTTFGSGSDQCKDGNNKNTGEHKYQGAELFFEFFRYLTGQRVHNGHTGYIDFGTSDDENMDELGSLPAGLLASPRNQNIDTSSSNLHDICLPSPIWDEEAETGTADSDGFDVYDSPLLSLSACGGDIYTFNFMFQVSSADSGSDDAIESTDPGGMIGIGNLASNSRFEDVLEYLNDIDLGAEDEDGDPIFGTVPDIGGTQNVTSYFFVPTTKVNQTTNGYATSGGTGATGAIGMDLEDVDATIDIITSTLESVLSVSTTFVSPTLPSNVFNRTDLLDQVYIAIFKADEDLKPRWNGNLKRLHINPNTTTVNGQTVSLGNPFLAGGDGTGRDTSVSSSSAVGPDGRIDQNTITVWTHPADVPANTSADEDFRLGKDGRSTVHGGAGGVIPGYRDPNTTDSITYNPGNTNPSGATTEISYRKIFTEPDSRNNDLDLALRAFNADDATALELLQIGDGTASQTATDDDYYQIKVDLWREIMPWSDCEDYVSGTVDEPANCVNYNLADADNTTNDEDVALARLKQLLAYGRGFEDYNVDSSLSTKKSWMMGDPLHSRPVAINYGGLTEASQNIRVALSTNDGTLHFIRVDDGVNPDGVEEWAFTPRSVVHKLNRLRENSVSPTPVHPYTMDGSPTVLLIDDDSDGIISPALSSNDEAYLYIGMRRGGKHYYALDITDYQAPKMKWSISKEDANFSELGQTWSQPSNVLIKYEDATDTVVERHALIFGGGFNGDDEGDELTDDNDIELGKDTRDDFDDDDSTIDDDDAESLEFKGWNDHEGNAIFIVDAKTGELIWKATGPRLTTTYDSGTDTYTTVTESVTTGDKVNIGGEPIHYRHADMADSIPSIVTAVNATNFTDIYDDRAYVGDTGGIIWRVDFSDTDRANWKVTKLANLGRHAHTTPVNENQANDRRFFHAVDFALASDEEGSFDAVVVASGNRPNPLTDKSENYLYMIRDRNTNTPASTDSSLDHDGLQDLSDNCLQDGDATDCTVAFDQNNFNNGWKIFLENCTDESSTGICGEKGLSKPLVFLGNIIFNSYIPPISQGGGAVCAPAEGNGQFYKIGLQDATAVENFNTANDSPAVTLERSERLASGGIPSDPVVAGSFSPDGTTTSTGILRPDLEIELIDSFGLLKKFWYTTEPE